jgi:hypothetical protein
MSKEAEELHELVTSSYLALEEDRKQSAPSRTESNRDTAAEGRTPAAQRRHERSGTDDNLLRKWIDLVRSVGGKLPYGVGFLIIMLAAIALVFLRGDDAGAPSNESIDQAAELAQDGPATPDPADADAASAVPEFVDADGGTPLSGTWTMYWRNSEGTDSAAFTLRFHGAEGGTVEVLNDETESDTWIVLDGEELRFGFTRTFQAPAKWPADNPYPAGGWDEKSEFTGQRVSDGQFLGRWYRDDWECRPDFVPPCVTQPDPAVYTAWIEQKP